MFFMYICSDKNRVGLAIRLLFSYGILSVKGNLLIDNSSHPNYFSVITNPSKQIGYKLGEGSLQWEEKRNRKDENQCMFSEKLQVMLAFIAQNPIQFCLNTLFSPLSPLSIHWFNLLFKAIYSRESCSLYISLSAGL